MSSNFNALLMNTLNFPSPPSSNQEQSTQSFPPQVGAGEHRRKKRSKLARITHQAGDSSKPRSGKKPDATAVKITRPCSECGKRFWSWKALFGHMRCHPERQWRGINPPPNFRRSDAVDGSNSSPLSSELTDEDHQVAESLVLLANGDNCDMSRFWSHRGHPDFSYSVGEPSRTNDVDQMAHLESSHCRFECSSCKRVFGSHQALGGHRASHKNVKGCFAIARSDGEDSDAIYNELSDNVGEGVGMEGIENREVGGEKMVMLLGHKCGICMRVFSSGQALGGHKRCHWEKDEQGVSSSFTTKGCVWDLNLPGPIENEDNSSEVVLDLTLGI
ncbi:hypothetical protein MRB53_000190 [Persea americana]|uniref:Uncharacterized protein n=1 Tax=Persea americana TaxID=3435 RepID=A0ACC2MN80_PERAE|nr:hypothetical protein MRB53_000190 [Persea americana]